MSMQVESGWWAIASSRALGTKRALRVDRFGRALALFRDREGAVRCLDDGCPHRGASLSMGQVVDGCVECPFHGFRFDGDGTCTRLPAHGDERPIPKAMRAPAYAVREAHGLIWMWQGAEAPHGEPSFFAAIDDRFSFGEFTSRWHTHYTRAVENQLDFTHLPFVHRTSIGRGLPSRMEVETEVSDAHVRARVRDGDRVAVEWRAPNVWTLQLSPKVVQFLAFMPVDDEHTDILCRAYQRQVRVPGLRAVYDWVSARANRWILGQDQAVVESQRPYETSLGMKELLVPSDSPIAAYRRIRHRALRERARLPVAS